MDHLDEQTLSELASSSLDLEVAKAAGEHLKTCAECQARFEAVSALLFSKTVDAPISRTPAPGSKPPTNPDRPGDPMRATDVVALLHKGTSLGRYVLLEKLGAGGMGEVFAAYDPHLDRKVALKLLRAGTLGAEEGKARLLREAQAMARLQHPNVAAVHDVGTFDDRVFVAMEFIEGETLSEWLRGQRSWQQVLRLFIQCGAGLSAAHAAGIVHRDFKPDNVLIGADERPRVVDFGLARHSATPTDSRAALGTIGDVPVDTSLASPITRDGAVLGTPGYMAPEQLAGLPTDARSDQFAFSVALFEALYGKRPFGGTTLKSHAAEIVAGRLAPVPANSPVPGWVHEAVLRGLSAEPGARFASMDAMIAALRPRQVVRRSRFVGLVAVLALVASSAVGYGLLAREKLKVCSGSEKRLENVWDEKVRTDLKAGFLATGVPFAPDAWKAVEAFVDGWTKQWVGAAGEACEAARIRKTDTEDDYQLKLNCLELRLLQLKTIMHVLDKPDAEKVQNAVRTVRGLKPVDACLDLVVLNKERRHPEHEKGHEKEPALNQALFEGRALHDAGKYAVAIEVMKRALAAGAGAPPAALAEAQLLMGRLLVRAGAAREAEAMLLAAAQSAESSGSGSLIARAYSRLAMVVGSMENRFDEAHTWQKLADAARAREGVREDKEVEAELESNSGQVALAESDYRGALDHFQNGLTLQEQALGEDSPEVGRTLNNLGVALAHLGKYKEAATQYKRSYDLQKKSVGEQHPDTAASMHNLAVMYRKDGKLTDALDYFERSLKVRQSTLGEEHPDTANSYQALANLQLKMDQPEAALENFSKALAIRQKLHGPSNPQVAAIYDDLAAFHLQRGDAKEALEAAQHALEIDEKTAGPQSLATAAAHDKAGYAFILLGQWDKALAEFNKALEAKLAKLGPASPEVAGAHNSLGDLWLAQGKGDRAMVEFQRALLLRREASGEESPALAFDLLGIGRAQLLLKQPAAALEPLSRALALRELSQDLAEVSSVRFELARATWEAKPEERGQAIEDAKAAREGLPPRKRDEVDKWLATHTPDAGVR